MLSIGIDPALNHTGIAILRDGEIHRTETWNTPSLKGVKRLVWLRSEFVRLIKEVESLQRPNELAWYGFEDYAYSLGHRAHQMGEWGGQLRITCHDNNIEPKIFNQSVVKKFATGKGTCKKEVLLMHVGQKWQLTFPTSDEAEAFLIAKMLYWICALDGRKRKAEELAKYQLEVLAKYLKRSPFRIEAKARR